MCKSVCPSLLQVCVCVCVCERDSVCVRGVSVHCSRLCVWCVGGGGGGGGVLSFECLNYFKFH